MKRPAALAALCLAAGCMGTPLQERFYTLSASAPLPEAPAARSTLTLHVGPVTVPEAVDRLPMVVRTSPHQVEVMDAHRWAEPLAAAIPRAIAEGLRRELGTAHVSAARLAATRGVDYRVTIEVQRFDSSTAEGAAIDALWTVTPKEGTARTGRTTLREAAPTPDPAGIAAAHSRLLEKMAAQIAAAIRAMGARAG